MLLGFSFAGLVYGGIHLLAWNAPFPSHATLTLWRSSGVLLASSGFICVVFCALVMVPLFSVGDWITQRPFWRDPKTKLDQRYKAILKIVVSLGDSIIFGFPLIAFAVLYLAARVYLVVESFLQLAHLPDSAYALPAWSQYYPHVT